MIGAAWLLSEPSSRPAPFCRSRGSDAVCSAVYGQLLHPEGAKAHRAIAVTEPLAQDPTDASARLRLYELRDLLQEDT